MKGGTQCVATESALDEFGCLVSPSLSELLAPPQDLFGASAKLDSGLATLEQQLDACGRGVLLSQGPWRSRSEMHRAIKS
eukprot:scaffold1397_cov254-Pinguiococcus_pyrenoidosus.AAC.63